jgi:hypothetical protein
MLNSIYKYKNTAGLFLLALYFFIATPVSLWHHHQSVSSDFKSTTSTSNACFSNAEDSNNGPCKICTHHYADCLQTATDFVAFAPLTNATIYNFSSVSLIKAPAYSLSNKGPPLSSAI